MLRDMHSVGIAPGGLLLSCLNLRQLFHDGSTLTQQLLALRVSDWYYRSLHSEPLLHLELDAQVLNLRVTPQRRVRRPENAENKPLSTI